MKDVREIVLGGHCGCLERKNKNKRM
jgi:hypothetical protein